MKFADGEEVVIRMKYERLHGVCSCCRRLCHDTSVCPQNHGFTKVGDGTKVDDHSALVLEDNAAGNSMSYKAALSQGKDQNQLGINTTGSSKNETTKRALNFEDPGARNQKKRAKFWQQKAKGKQAVPRSSKGSAHHANCGFSSETQNRRQCGIQIGKSESARVEQMQVDLVNENSPGLNYENGDGGQQIQLSDFEQQVITELSNVEHVVSTKNGDILTADIQVDSSISIPNVAVGDLVQEKVQIPSMVLEEGDSQFPFLEPIGEDGEFLGFEGLDVATDMHAENKIVLIDPVDDASLTQDSTVKVVDATAKVKDDLPRMHLVRNGVPLPGVITKKRFPQLLASPRRKTVNESDTRVGDGKSSKNDPDKKI